MKAVHNTINMTRAVVITRGGKPIAVVSDVDQGIAKIKEWNNECTFKESYNTGGAIVTQKNPDNTFYVWILTEVSIYQ